MIRYLPTFDISGAGICRMAFRENNDVQSRPCGTRRSDGMSLRYPMYHDELLRTLSICRMSVMPLLYDSIGVIALGILLQMRMLQLLQECARKTFPGVTSQVCRGGKWSRMCISMIMRTIRPRFAIMIEAARDQVSTAQADHRACSSRIAIPASPISLMRLRSALDEADEVYPVRFSGECRPGTGCPCHDR